jgi:D-alanyl-D-alanine carboxypeptidase
MRFFSRHSLVKVIIFILVIAFAGSPAYAKSKKRHKAKAKAATGNSCQAVILSNTTSVDRLYGKNVNSKVKPASTTKVMTALLAMENLSLNQYVTVSARATQVQPSKLDLRAGERYKVSDLLEAAVVNSANDAAVVLAEAVAGSEWQFVQMMNARAKQLGAKNTKFANSHGLPSGKTSQYTTAYDMYLIFLKALKYPFFRDVIKMKYGSMTSQGGRQISFKSHNKMLFRRPGLVKGKTGWTYASRHTFVGTNYDPRNTQGSPDPRRLRHRPRSSRLVSPMQDERLGAFR